MRCSFCGGETFVTNCATNDHNTYRIRKCKKCGRKYGTKEIFTPYAVSQTQINMIKAIIREHKQHV